MRQLTTLTKTWKGVEYYCVDVEMNDPDASNSLTTWIAMQRWCINLLGPQGDPWEDSLPRWYFNNSKFWFREERARTLFILRWS